MSSLTKRSVVRDNTSALTVESQKFLMREVTQVPNILVTADTPIL